MMPFSIANSPCQLLCTLLQLFYIYRIVFISNPIMLLICIFLIQMQCYYTMMWGKGIIIIAIVSSAKLPMPEDPISLSSSLQATQQQYEA